MFIDQEIGVIDGLDLGVLVLVDVFEEVQFGEEGLVLGLDSLELEEDAFFGFDLALVEHDPGVLVEFLEFAHGFVSSLLLVLIVHEHPLVDILNAHDLPFDLSLHDLDIPFELFMHLINGHDFMVLVI